MKPSLIEPAPVATLKKRVWDFVEVNETSSKVERAFDAGMLTLIFLNVVAVIIESVQAIEQRYAAAFYWFEAFSVAVFTAEYVARVWSCVSRFEYRHPLWGRLRLMVKPLYLIDLFTFLPFYLPFIGIDLRSIRVLRLLRIFRVAKVARYSSSLQLLGRVFKSKREELVLSTVVMVLLLVLASSLMYHVEYEAQPDKFSDIPSTMWWAIATLTTVGYGDIYPVTNVGKVLGSLVAVLGIGMFALPAGVLGAGFVEEIQRSRMKPKQCPHCGQEID